MNENYNQAIKRCHKILKERTFKNVNCNPCLKEVNKQHKMVNCSKCLKPHCKIEAIQFF